MRKTERNRFLGVQILFVAAFATAFAILPAQSNTTGARTVPGSPFTDVAAPERQIPLKVGPLYDDADVVSDEQLAAVLERVRPRFSRSNLKPNFVEHALRTWGVAATFSEPGIMSGIELRDVLVDHGRFLQSWNDETEPLLIDRELGIGIRSTKAPGGSVHHDHWLASLTEAGVELGEPVFTPARRNGTINSVLQESLRDFRLDEREVEWSAMAFGLWLPPQKSWHTGDGREMNFDRIARRLVRGHKRFGVCSGTHRVYSLVVLLRLDDEFGILSTGTRNEVWNYVAHVRDLLSESQFDDGHWPSNWSIGAGALEDRIEETVHRKVVATGHHLEWMAIAPVELHPQHDRILKAADWVIRTVVEQPQSEILRKYTFYSHVGNALALWRGTRPADFWHEWREQHPYSPERSEPE